MRNRSAHISMERCEGFEPPLPAWKAITISQVGFFKQVRRKSCFSACIHYTNTAKDCRVLSRSVRDQTEGERHERAFDYGVNSRHRTCALGFSDRSSCQLSYVHIRGGCFRILHGFHHYPSRQLIPQSFPCSLIPDIGAAFNVALYDVLETNDDGFTPFGMTSSDTLLPSAVVGAGRFELPCLSRRSYSPLPSAAQPYSHIEQLYPIFARVHPATTRLGGQVVNPMVSVTGFEPASL